MIFYNKGLGTRFKNWLKRHGVDIPETELLGCNFLPKIVCLLFARELHKAVQDIYEQNMLLVDTEVETTPISPSSNSVTCEQENAIPAADPTIPGTLSISSATTTAIVRSGTTTSASVSTGFATKPLHTPRSGPDLQNNVKLESDGICNYKRGEQLHSRFWKVHRKNDVGNTLFPRAKWG